MKIVILVLLSFVLVGAHVIDNKKTDIASDDNGEWWRSGVFYQIYPRSFMDNDDSGEGDLRGIINKLDHLKDLGVTGVWLNPIFVSPMKDGGYDIADFYNIDERYGTLEDLEELFVKAKELGIRILLDLVPNHTSDEHEWFLKSVRREPGYENFYVWQDCKTEIQNGTHVVTEYPNNWIAVFHTRAWSYHPERGQCYLHQFLAGQPDLNYRNENVTKALEDVLLFWFEKGVNGLRIDAINHMFETEGFPDEPYIDEDGDTTHYDNLDHIHTRDLDESYQVIFRWRKLMEDYATEHGTDKIFMMTEAYADIDNQIKWYGTEEQPGSHMPFNFALISNLDRYSTAHDFQNAVHAWYSRLPSFGEANWVLGNHDRPRIGYRYGEDRHESLVMMTMLLPGINVVYYGEEILMTDNRDITWEETDDPNACQTNETVFQLYTRDPVRTPFQWDDSTNAGFSNAEKTWLPVHKNYKELNLKAQKEAEKSTFKYYKHLISLRKENIFKYGEFRSMAINRQVFAFVRKYESEHPVVVFINLGDRAVLSVRSILRIGEIPPNAVGKVLAAVHTSSYDINDLLNPDQFVLDKHEAIAIQVIEGEVTTTTAPLTTTTPSSASTIASSILVAVSVIFYALL
ncbi:maltase 2-like [Chironomus tepperi]|uniref:maltase 2-like n=1 Tax=Chironomus tepperi TaxID=113505 RepID=UPI00391F9507